MIAIGIVNESKRFQMVLKSIVPKCGGLENEDRQLKNLR